MARQVLQDQEGYGVHRGKLNANFSELYNIKVESTQVLVRTNTVPYTPTSPYNPATKQYVDNFNDSIISTYDPQGINGDAFDRSNHTGDMPAENVTQATLLRFVTDTDISNWNGKEDAIGVKNTAFNKNFGTTAGTVAEGNHNHTGTYEPADIDIQTHITDTVGNPHNITPAKIGLGNVDNVGNSDREYLDINPPVSIPSYKEGRLFYDDNEKCISYYNDESDVVLCIGQEFYVRVYNDTGVTITNGSAVRITNDAISGFPEVVLAIANDFVNSNLIGLATHDIEHASYGFVTRMGLLKDVDTSAFSTGDRLYLSDTVAGGWGTNIPDIVSYIGQVRFADPTDGIIFVNPFPNLSLPLTFGLLEDTTPTYSLTTSYQDLTNWDSSNSIVVLTNTTTGVVTTASNAPGQFKLTGFFTCTFPSSNGERTVTFQLWDVTNSLSVAEAIMTISRDFTQQSFTFIKYFVCGGGIEYKIRIKASESIDPFDIDDSNVAIESIFTGVPVS